LHENLVVLTFKNEIRVEKGYNDSSVSVHRGPLLFAMDIGNDAAVVNSSDGGSPKGATPWKEYEVTASKPWNIALDATAANLQFVPLTGALPQQPFDPDTAPVHIKARGRLLPEVTSLCKQSRRCLRLRGLFPDGLLVITVGDA
jgi:hypothetical protein